MATEQTAQTARAEAGAVAGTVKEETKNVVQEAQQQASSALHQVQDDVRTRANEEATKFAQTLHDTSQQAPDRWPVRPAIRALRRAWSAKAANATERLASRLDQGGVDAVMARHARVRPAAGPAAFLLGAVTVGFLTGRLARNLSGGGQPSPTGVTTASAIPRVGRPGRVRRRRLRTNGGPA